jgi:serine/threonine protein kinase
MEYCANGDLLNFMKNKVKGRLPHALANGLFSQILDAVDAMHSQCGIAHLDLKLDNILLSDEYQVKLCDVGFSQSAHGLLFQTAGTDGFKAPEIHKTAEGGDYFFGDSQFISNMSGWSSSSAEPARKLGYNGGRADIFSLGVILFILHFGVPPFMEARFTDRLYKLLNFKGNGSSIPDKKLNLRFFLR